MLNRMIGIAALSLPIIACAHWRSHSECFEPTLDGVAWGANVQETLSRAEIRGSSCSVRASEYTGRVVLHCTKGVGPMASEHRFSFVEDELASATLERSAPGPLGRCAEADLGFARWSESVLAGLAARYGPPESATSPRDARPGETYRWSSPDDEIRLEVFSEEQRLAISGGDRAAFREALFSEAEFARLVQDTSPRVSYRAMFEEVTYNLMSIRTAEQSYYSEFGHYLAAGPFPPVPPRGAYLSWRIEEDESFAKLGWEPRLGRVSCSYAVGVSPGSCDQGGCRTFTAEARCDPEGDGRVVHWGLVPRPRQDPSAEGRFGICRAEGVYDPDTGEPLGHDVVGLCERPPPGAHDGGGPTQLGSDS